MLAFFHSFILLAAEASHSEGGFADFYNKYLNYPGFEAWKFINLTIFVLIMIYLLKKPLSDAFKAKREDIRAELIKAEEEKQAALSRLTAAEAKLVGADNEKASILKNATAEAAAEKARIAEHTRAEAEKTRQQAESEIARLSNQAKVELRRFSANESIRLAEERLRSEIDAEKDAKLVKAGIQSIGGLN